MRNLSENLFSHIGAEFFRPLASPNAALYLDALDRLERTSAEQPNGLARDDAVALLSDLIEQAPDLIPEDAFAATEVKDLDAAATNAIRARLILTRLTESGWLEEETIGFSRVLRFSSEGSVLLTALRQIARPENPFYTHKLEAVCDALLRLDASDRNPWATVETGLGNLAEGLRELGLLEASLRRLTRRALAGQTLAENLDVFFNRFAGELAPQTHHKLVRAQLPLRLLLAARRVERLFNDEPMLDKLREGVREQQPDLAPEPAARRVRALLDELARLLVHVEPAVERVDRRTGDFARRSLARFRYLQEVGGERRHQIRDLFEWVRQHHARARLVDLSDFGLPAENDFPPLRVIEVSLFGGLESLYAPRQRLAPAEIEPMEEVSPDAAEAAERELAAALRESLGVWRANTFVERLPGDRGAEIPSSAFPLRHDDDILDLVACLLHAGSGDARYTVAVSRAAVERKEADDIAPQRRAGYVIEPLVLTKR